MKVELHDGSGAIPYRRPGEVLYWYGDEFALVYGPVSPNDYCFVHDFPFCQLHTQRGCKQMISEEQNHAEMRRHGLSDIEQMAHNDARKRRLRADELRLMQANEDIRVATGTTPLADLMDAAAKALIDARKKGDPPVW